MKTTKAAKSLKTTERKWYLVDATDKTLGRMCTAISKVLIGKNKPLFSYHADTGDYVIVTNADKFKVTGKKMSDKIYYTHSGYLGHLKEKTMAELMKRKPTEILKLAVYGMLPKNKLRYAMMKRLRLFKNAEHSHAPQNPENLIF